MKDASQAALSFFVNDAEGIVFGVPRVNHDRQIAADREANLGAKHGVLHFARREVVVVVEPDLTNRARVGHGVEPAGADRLLVETDSPSLAPVTYRGKRNEPAYVAKVVEQLAAVRGTTAAAIGEQTDRNFERLFGR